MILQYPSPSLKCIASQVIEKPNTETIERIYLMLRLMYRFKGVGLAANQIGWKAAIFVSNYKIRGSSTERIYINPKIVKCSGFQKEIEGCLSLPSVEGKVRRFSEIQVTAYDIDGNSFSHAATGFEASIIQHEVDHLNGLLIIDRMENATRSLQRGKLKKLEKYAKMVRRGNFG